MNVRIKRIDTNLPLPKYETAGAVGFDLYVREGAIVQPHMPHAFPMNVIVEIPKGFMLTVLPRSSTVKKTGLLIPHGFGAIDQDYHGPKDELLLLLYNPTDTPITIERGARIGQGIFVQVGIAQWEEQGDDLKSDSRGGYGSTG